MSQSEPSADAAGGPKGAPRAPGADLGAAVRALLDGVGDLAATASGSHAAGASSGDTGSGSAGFASSAQGWLDAAMGGSAGTHTVSTCGVCPICIGLAALARSHPDVLTHLAEAAQSLLSAVAAMTQPPAHGADASPNAGRAAGPAAGAGAAGAAGAPRPNHTGAAGPGPAADEQRITVTD